DPEVLHALLRGVRVDLASAEAAAASAERIRAALSLAHAGNGANGNGHGRAVNIRTRYDEKSERHQLVVERLHHGNLKTCVLDDDFFLSGDYRQIEQTGQLLEGLIGEGAVIRRDDKEQPV